MGAFFSVKCSGLSSQKISTIYVANRKTVFHSLKFTNYNIIFALKAISKKEVKILSIYV